MVETSVYNDIFKVLVNSNTLFVKSEVNIKEGVHIDLGYELSETSFFTYIYDDRNLFVFDPEVSEFSQRFEDRRFILGCNNDSNQFLLFDKYSDEVKCLDHFKVMFSFSFSKNISLYNRDYLITSSGKSLTKRNLIEIYRLEAVPTLLSSFFLGDDYKILGDINLVGERLFFIIHSRGARSKKVIGIDIKKEKKVWELEYNVPYETNFIATTLHEKFTYGLSSKFYQVFDPVNGEFLVEINIENSLPEGVSPEINRQSVADGRLWFVSGRGNEVTFGAFDIKKSEIAFIQSHPLSEEDQFDTPVYHQGKLYLRTLHSNTLHIFE
jgi:hypothetical protein